MRDSDTKLIFEAYNKNVINEEALTTTAIAFGALFVIAGLFGLTQLQRNLQNINFDFLRRTAPKEASLLETMNEAAKDFASALESGDFNEIRTKGEQIALLYQDVPGAMNPLFKTAGSIIIESFNNYENTEDDAYLAAATVSIGSGFIKVVQQMIQSVNASVEIPDETKQKIVSILNPIVSEISSTVSTAQQYLEELKVEMATSKAGKTAGSQKSTQQGAGSRSPSPQPPKRKPPKKRRGKGSFRKAWEKIGKTKAAEQWRYVNFGLVLVAGVGAVVGVGAAAYGVASSSGAIVRIIRNIFGMGEDVSETGKTATGAIADATKAADETTRSTWASWKNWIASFWEDDPDTQQEEPPKSTPTTGSGTEQDPIVIKFSDIPNSKPEDESKFVNTIQRNPEDGKYYKIIK